MGQILRRPQIWSLVARLAPSLDHSIFGILLHTHFPGFWADSRAVLVWFQSMGLRLLLLVAGCRGNSWQSMAVGSASPYVSVQQLICKCRSFLGTCWTFHSFQTCCRIFWFYHILSQNNMIFWFNTFVDDRVFPIQMTKLRQIQQPSTSNKRFTWTAGDHRRVLYGRSSLDPNTWRYVVTYHMLGHMNSGDIPLIYIGLIYGRYLQFLSVRESWPLNSGFEWIYRDLCCSEQHPELPADEFHGFWPASLKNLYGSIDLSGFDWKSGYPKSTEL